MTQMMNIIENPTSFHEIETCERFFIFGNDEKAHRLHLLLAGKFETRFFGFFKASGEQEYDKTTMFLVRSLTDTLEKLGPGDFIFLFLHDAELEQKLLEKQVRLGYPHNFLSTFSTYEAPILNTFLKATFDAKKPADIALDIGANFGLTATTMAPYFQKIHAFEPNLKIYENLKRNYTLPKNIDLHQVALGPETGERVFYDMDGANGSILKPKIDTPSYKVSMDTVDNFCISRDLQPRFIKIDAEGLDGDIIVSSEKIIEKYRPLIFFENPAAGPHDKAVWADQLKFISRYYDLKAYPCLNQLVKHEHIGCDYFEFKKLYEQETLNIAAIPKRA
ncbi:FkbM family methyltransferase [Kordiimonas pumila]|uniref:FkbM family methyltransferase n=1 Tax=Kordiimonas pumila TaxID=2161677 RepID=A0ABV7D960_9PROT|nr:FkbM family methyltransferase [Kordiimonas pumila]